MKCGAMVTVAAMGLSGGGVAAPVLVQNPGFEAAVELPLGGTGFPNAGTFNFDDIPGWSATQQGGSGVFRPDPASGVLLLPDGFGLNTMFTNGFGIVVRQELGAVVEAGFQYRLRVEIGDRTDLFLGGGQGGSIGLFTPAGDELAVAEFGGDFVVSSWRALEAVYVAEGAFVGSPLEVRLSGRGPQVNFDNVVLVRELVGACSAADLSAPTGVLDLSDVSAFIDAFVGSGAAGDLAAPFGVWDLSDVSVFVDAFVGGCG